MKLLVGSLRSHTETDNPDQSAVLCDTALVQIARRAYQSDGVLGVLVYGSSATGRFDKDSDVDLIYVLKSGPRFQRECQVDGTDVDLYGASASDLSSAIHRDVKNNNNFVLFAFAHGRLLLAVDGTLDLLISQARESWARGPVKPTAEEMDTLAAAVAKGAGAAHRLALRSTRSLEWREIAMVQCSHLFLQTMYAYCRANGLWSSAIWEMLTWREPKYSEILALCRTYLSSTTIGERACAIERIAEATLHGRIGTRSPGVAKA